MCSIPTTEWQIVSPWEWESHWLWHCYFGRECSFSAKPRTCAGKKRRWARLPEVLPFWLCGCVCQSFHGIRFIAWTILPQRWCQVFNFPTVFWPLQHCVQYWWQVLWPKRSRDSMRRTDCSSILPEWWYWLCAAVFTWWMICFRRLTITGSTERKEWEAAILPERNTCPTERMPPCSGPMILMPQKQWILRTIIRME